MGWEKQKTNLYALNMANPSSHRYNHCCLVCGHKCHPSHFVGGRGWGSGCDCKIVMAVICRSDCDWPGSHKWAGGDQRFNSGSDGGSPHRQSGLTSHGTRHLNIQGVACPEVWVASCQLWARSALSTSCSSLRSPQDPRRWGNS